MGAGFLTVGEGVKMQKKRKLERTLQCWFGIWGYQFELMDFNKHTYSNKHSFVFNEHSNKHIIDVKVCVCVHIYSLVLYTKNLGAANPQLNSM